MSDPWRVPATERVRTGYGFGRKRSGPERTSSTWAQIKAVLGDQKRALALLAIASAICGLAESGILAVLAQAAAALVEGKSRVRFSFGSLHVQESLSALLTIGVLLALLRLALQGVISTVPARMVVHLQLRLRTQTLAAFEDAPWDLKARDREGHVQELLTSHVAQASQSAAQAATLLVVSLSSLMLVVAALTLNVVAAVVVLVVAVGLFVLLRPLGNLGRHYARELSQAAISYAGGANQAVRLAEDVHVFGVAAAQQEQVNELLGAMRTPLFRTQVLNRLIPGIYQSLIYLFVVGALAVLLITGTSHVASLGAVVLLLVRAGAYGQQMQSSFQSLQQALPFYERIRAAQQRYIIARPVPGEHRLGDIRGLTFSNVRFAYDPARPVLSDIGFEVASGEAVGIIGPTGAGKSTLVQILLGLRTPDSGRYLVNGMPAERFRPQDWHERFAYVPQEPRLLHASVADNIRFFRPIDDIAVKRAARLAGIHDEVISWPARYDTLVGPRADAVSGGQQQRICLARALAADPGVLVLDEPTSALDAHAERLIQESLVGLKGRLTLFIVAHRLSTLDICDRVMVIVEGRLQAFSRFAELETDSAYYRSASQIGRPTRAALPTK